jgi:hypothetical protein
MTEVLQPTAGRLNLVHSAGGALAAGWPSKSLPKRSSSDSDARKPRRRPIYTRAEPASQCG